MKVSLRQVGMARSEAVKKLIMGALEDAAAIGSNVIPVGDKSDPREFNACFKSSITKTEFKSAVGALYKQGLVVPGRIETRLATAEERVAFLAKAGAGAGACAGAGAGDRIGSAIRSNTNINTNTNTNTVFIGNLPKSINEVILRNTVVKVLGEGVVLGLRMPLRRGNEQRQGHGHGTDLGSDVGAGVGAGAGMENLAGYAYIDLSVEQDVTKAISALRGVECMGRKLRADVATPRQSPYSKTVAKAK